MEEAREVENVGPEEHAPGGACSQWEAKEVFERGGSHAPPQPACVVGFRGGGEERAGENHSGEGGHQEAMDGGEGAEGDRAAAPEEVEEEVEGEGGGDIGSNGGYEKGPCGAP